MILRRMLAIWISKATCVVCKLAGKQGVTLAGKIALKIDPKILMELSGQVRKKIFITCGTNGKTTTNNLLCSAIEAEGEKVICNHTGSNMLNGVVSAFVLAAKWNGKLDADYACIEIDEASTVRVLPYFKPDYMSIEKLFFNRNVTTAIPVGQARGVALLAAANKKLPIMEFTPMQIKLSVVGTGSATKEQVIYMVMHLLNIREKIKPDDTADALAAAICGLNTASTRRWQEGR